MKKILNEMFKGDDGRVSWTAVSAALAVVLFLTWYVNYFFLGWQFQSDILTFMEFLIATFLGVRGIQRGIYYGTNSLAEVKRAVTPTTAEKTQQKPPKQATRPDTTQAPEPQTGNFQLSEFQSKDGTPMNASVKANIMHLIDQLEIIRAACGNKPITITSGYRSRKHNASVGGAKNSYHTKGQAADFKVIGMRPAEVYKIVESLMDSGQITAGGIGLYKSWCHYDTRGTKTTWKD